MNTTTRNFILLSAVLGFLGVAIGAFGAHGLKTTLEANGREDTFETATRYHIYHALALLGVAWLSSITTERYVKLAGWLMFSGALIFSGALYVLALFNVGMMGVVAPIGGALMLVGWLCVGLTALNAKS